MSELARTYRRWAGVLKRGPVAHIVALEEWRRAYRTSWVQIAGAAALLYTALYIGQLYTLSQSRGDAVHSWENFTGFLDDVRWAALAIAALMAGPSLLEDHRRGALELYGARPLTRAGYLTAKIGAVLTATTATMFVPALLYFVVSFVVFDTRPDGFAWAPLKSLVYALLWAVPISGIGMGLSCVGRSSRAATLFLFGGAASLDVVVSKLLASITRNPGLNILSPFSALSRQKEWLFGVVRSDNFPAWWGLVELIGLAIVGWGLVALRHPRPAGGARE